MVERIDITGQRYGRLVVVERSASPINTRWVCKCDCGSSTVVRTKDLRRKNGTRSCGCLSRETARSLATRHGQHKTPTYNSWTGMHVRCRSKDKAKTLYWERGISVCERWKSFENFLEDMGERPAGTSIDRIDNDRGYEPGNCRWATTRQQNLNKRNIKFLTHNGKTMCAKDWALEMGMPYGRLLSRLKAGWSLTEALSDQPRKKKSKSSSGQFGVSWDRSRQKWIAYAHDGKNFRNLGRFDDKADALLAREQAEKRGP